MTKTKKETKVQKTLKQNILTRFSINELIPEKYHVLTVALVVFILFLIFFNPLYFGGKNISIWRYNCQ
jgi:hypothetical protein